MLCAIRNVDKRLGTLEYRTIAAKIKQENQAKDLPHLVFAIALTSVLVVALLDPA